MIGLFGCGPVRRRFRSGRVEREDGSGGDEAAE